MNTSPKCSGSIQVVLTKIFIDSCIFVVLNQVRGCILKIALHSDPFESTLLSKHKQPILLLVTSNQGN